MVSKSKKKYRLFTLQLIIAASSYLFLPSHLEAAQRLPAGYYAAQKVLNGLVLPPPASNALPNIRQVISGVAGLEKNAAGNRLTIHQNGKKAILDWNSFNIGANAETAFDQQGHANWAALNRIYDNDPSQIFGKLKADGKVFLLNHNGILFGPDSTTNVHSLVASSLNLDQNDFLNNIMHFKTAAGVGEAPGAVINQGSITTDQTGSVFLIGPRVENSTVLDGNGKVKSSGTINAPAGQIGLIAGEDVTIVPVTDKNEAKTRLASKVSINDGLGTAVNMAHSRLESKTGLIGMYGKVVNQEGMIRTVVALENQNRTGIELMASDHITTGPDSVTEAPISTTNKTQILKSKFKGGDIWFGGLSSGKYNKDTRTGWIKHEGKITAPTGVVTMKAAQRILLDSGSSIDVSGNWVARPMEDAFVNVKLTSEVLRDNYVNKNGPLFGATIRVNAREGTSIGDISGALARRENTALQNSTTAGTITLDAYSGTVVINPGASLDFAGGGTVYKSGLVATTKLVANNKAYDIAKASENLIYEGVFGYYEKKFERYNTTDVYSGTSYGNGTMKYFEGFTEGSDAGRLEITANALALNGSLNGHAIAGIYQTEKKENVNSFEKLVTRGRRRPQGGALTLQGPASGTQNVVDNFDAVVIAAGWGAGIRLSMDDLLPTTTVNGISQAATILPADMISFAGLSYLGVAADTSLEIDKDAVLRLEAGGELTGRARLVINRGAIDIPGGTVSLYSDENMTAYHSTDPDTPDKYIDMPEGIVLTNTSRIDVSGEEIDNRQVGQIANGELRHGIIAGGKVSLHDEIDYTRSDGQLVIDKGAVVDVSGGYEITTKGELLGGNGGQIDLQGTAIVQEGILRGRSLAGSSGGTIALHSERVLIGGKVPELPGNNDGPQPLPVDFFAGYLPENLKGGPIDETAPGRARGLVLDPDKLRDSGFANIIVKSVGDLFVQSGTELSPSASKNASPLRNTPVSARNGGAQQEPEVVQMEEDLLGPTSLSLAAGQEFTWEDRDTNQPVRTLDQARLIVEKKAVLRTTPTAAPEKSSITLLGPTVEIDGQVLAPSGDIRIVAETATQKMPVIHVTDTATISVAGANVLNRIPGAVNQPLTYTSLDAGSIALKTQMGKVLVDKLAVLDVSGSAPAVAGYYRELSGGADLHEALSASKAGRLDIEFGEALDLAGELRGGSAMAGIDGGELSITRRMDNAALNVSNSDLGVWLADGFESLSLTSYSEVRFSGAVNRTVPRTLTLDAPVISGSGEDISLSANHVQLRNSLYAFSSDVRGNAATAGKMDISGNWLDVEGGSYFKGFDNVSLRSQNDLTLDDIYSNNGSSSVWLRTLVADNDLTIRAARIFPRTAADFTVKAGGKITILPGKKEESRRPIYSAGGQLVIEGQDIDLEGYVAAPMGRISLTAAADDGRIYLAPGATVSTRGEADVAYGLLGEESWSVASTTNNPNTLGLNTVVNGAPEKAVALNGNEVIVSQGADIDVGGGGAISGSLFLPGIEGSANPLAGNYVISPDHSVEQSGLAVFLEGSEKLGLNAGLYSLLPVEEYAFVPGALIVESLGITALPGQQGETVRQGVVLAGYETETGITAVPAQRTGFLVRSASDVLREGNFTVRSLAAAEGGAVSLTATTAILDGSIEAAAMTGHTGGSLDLAVLNPIEVGSGKAPLPADFSFTSEIPKTLAGKFLLNGEAVSTAGLSKMTLGAISYDTLHQIIAAKTTDSITMLENSRLSVPELSLNADNIYMKAGATLEALSGKGSLTLSAGRVDTAVGSEMHAAHAFSLEADTLDMNGALKVDNSSLSLLSSNMYFLPQGVSYQDIVARGGNPEDKGMYLPYSLLEVMSGQDNVTLQGRKGIEFLADTNLKMAGNLTLDGARLTADANHQVSLNALTVTLLHSGNEAAEVGGNTTGSGGSLAISANEIQIGKGDLQIDGFHNISFDAGKGDLVFRGKGSLTAKGDLQLSGNKVTTSYYQVGDEPYQPTDFAVKAVDSVLTVLPGTNESGVVSGTLEVPGGGLELTGRKVDISGDIEVPAGRLLVTATGTANDGDGIFLRDGALLAARGNVYEKRIQAGGGEQTLTTVTPGGYINLQSEKGRIDLAAGSHIDVSTLKGDGEAGEISLYAPMAGVGLGGKLSAHTAGIGAGGALSLATDKIGTFSTFYASIEQAGFSRALELGVRSGDIIIDTNDMVTTPNLTLSSEDGNILVKGTIDASTAGDGGTVKLYGKNVEIDGGRVLAKGKNGGTVEMGTVTGQNMDDADGWITMINGALVDVSGSSGTGGKVYLRAGVKVAGDDVKVNLRGGTISGAAETVVEAVQVQQLNPGASVSSFSTYSWQTIAQNFMTAQQADTNKGKSRLLAELGAGADNFYLRPGIEVRSAPGSDLKVSGKLNLGKLRFDVEPGRPKETGVLTLRSPDNLTVQGDIIDVPTGAAAAPAGENPSWDINLVAGADTASGNVMATNVGSGDLAVGTGGTKSVVISDSGDVSFASGGNTTIGKGKSQEGYFYFNNSGVAKTFEHLDYTIASVAGDISGRVRSDLTFTGGAIQDGSGSISLEVDGNLDLDKGAIRTIGKPPENVNEVFITSIQNLLLARHIQPQSPIWNRIITMYSEPQRLQQFWEYQNGGDISIKVGKNYKSMLDNTPWDLAYTLKVSASKSLDFWAANYGNTNSDGLRGLAAMGGGSVDIRAGGDFTGRAGTFGAGDLTIRAGRNINGRFLVAQGDGSISSMANIGTSNSFPTALELLDARVNVSAQGDLVLGGIVNPTIASEKFNNSKHWNLTYNYSQIDPVTGELISADTAAHLTSVFGDVAISGSYDSYYQSLSGVNSETHWRFTHLLPPVLDLKAGQDIRLSGIETYLMAPSPTGKLSMIAGGGISGQKFNNYGKLDILNVLTIAMADMDPVTVYGDHGGEIFNEVGKRFLSEDILKRMNNKSGVSTVLGDGATTVVPLHSGDQMPVTILAGNDISDIGLTLAKQTRISAGGDINGFNYIGQNISADDISEIRAGGDISLEKTADHNFNTIIKQGGPGFLLVKADGSLNLGNSKGIITNGNVENLSLDADGSTLAVMVGYDKKLSESELRDFFGRLREAGKEYSRLLADGSNEAAAKVLADTRQGVILPALYGAVDNGSMRGTDIMAPGAYDGGGNLDMINSEISTSGGADDIFMVVRGNINVGRTTFSSDSSQKNTGITTVRSGGINIFTGYGDLNVNESRLMTFMGGDITAWSDYGNINAGRGSTTAISAVGETFTNNADGDLVPVFSPPSVGSGIRTLTFDPDGSNGPLTAPVAGDVALFAPAGEIDAGEAGINGTNVILAATKVVNAQNINFSQGGIGVPASGDAAGGIGALSGASDLGGVGKNIAESTSALARAKQQFADEAAMLADTFQLKWLSVEFTGFGSK